jgi:pyrroloquinoline-quinone synthase
VSVDVATTMTALSIGKGVTLGSAADLEATLRRIGEVRYHNHHPFHKLLHGGKLNKGQVQAWALNRYYYQSTIPIKDAVVISRFRDRTTRLEWRHRIEDHDGDIGSEGGIERWLKLTEGLGLDTAYVESTEGILPATRFAVEAYVHFCRDRTPLEAIASSLTELFAPNLHEERISGMLQHYDFVNPEIMAYFKRRLAQAPRDAGFALEYVKEHARTPEQREAVCNALIFKTNVLWVQLDALYHAYVNGHIPPGAFVPKDN